MDETTQIVIAAISALGSAYAAARGGKKGGEDGNKKLEQKVDNLQGEMLAHRFEARDTRAAVDGVKADVQRLEGRVQEQGAAILAGGRISDANTAKLKAVHQRLDDMVKHGRSITPDMVPLSKGVDDS